MDYFKELGTRVGRRWKQAHHNEKEFSTIAQEELERTPAHQHIEAEDVLEWVNQPDFQLPAQADIRAAFGDPPVTVYRGQHFYIDVNFWLDSTTSIHGHGFDGAFQVLSGSSLHTPYSYAEERCFSASTGLGKLTPFASEVLRPGDTRTILAGQNFTHALFHLEHPSSTVVIRTEYNRTIGSQSDFYPPGLRLEANFVDATVERNLQVASLFIQTGSPRLDGWLTRFLEHAGPRAAFRMLRQVYIELRQHADLSPADLDDFMGRHIATIASRPDWGPVVAQAVRETIKGVVLKSARGHIKDPGERFFLSLLLNLTTASAILELVQQRYPDESPVDRVCGWIASLCTRGESVASVLEINLNAPSQRLLRYLIEGRPIDAIASQMSADYGKKVSPAAVEQMITQLRDSSLAPLAQYR